MVYVGYFPKGSNFKKYSSEYIDASTNLLNNRPRKRLTIKRQIFHKIVALIYKR